MQFWSKVLIIPFRINLAVSLKATISLHTLAPISHASFSRSCSNPQLYPGFTKTILRIGPAAARGDWVLIKEGPVVWRLAAVPPAWYPAI